MAGFHKANGGGKSGERRENDFYPTPPWATHALVSMERKFIDRRLATSRSSVWEPASGRGWMASELARSYPVTASDKYEYGDQLFPCLKLDFLADDPPPGWNGVIVTNPPYGNDGAEKFVRRALSLSGYVAVLCRLMFAEGMKRYALFSEYPPSRVLFFSRRFSCVEEAFGTKAETGGMVAFAWWVWDDTRPGEKKVDWIGPDAYEEWKESTSDAVRL